MGAEPNIGQFLNEIKSARTAIETRDQKTVERVNDLEESINEILLGMKRPGWDGGGDRDIERTSAIQMCQDPALVAKPEERRRALHRVRAGR